MNYLNSTIIAEATENHISNHSRMYSEKSLEFEKHSEIIDDNMQEFINDSHKTSYEQEMYLEGSGLNSEFKMNLLIFYLAFSMVLIVKVLASAGLYISNEISEVYAWVNIGGTFLVFALAFILLIGVLCSDLMKSYIRPAYIALFSFILIFFSMCDSGNLHKFLGSSSTQTIDYSNSMYILVMLLFMKDLLFDSFIATLILGIFTIISPLVAFLATSRTDFNYFLSGHIVLTVMAIYLIVCSSRRDKKQKIFFKGRYEQKRIVDWTDKTHDTPHAKTRREKVIRIANSTIGLLQKVNPVILSAQLQKEIEKGLNSLQTMKGNLLEWPAHREKTISRCFFPGNEGLMFEENLNDYYYQILSLKNLKIFGIEENLRDMIKDWNFDVFTLKLEKSFFRCARYLCVDYTRVFEDLALPYQEFENFFCRLESLYLKNPYHNKFHALDVLHSLFYFFDVSLLSEKIFPIDLLICVIAALGHDANHPGLDNFYQIISASDLALKYNDKSVLENMHCAEIFKLLSVKENNFLKDLENRDVTYMRKNIIELVLGTDFSTYFEAIGELSVLLENTSFKDFNLKNKMLILSIGLKCADIGHTAKETDLYIEWSRLITKEYQKQDHMEKSLNIEVSPIILQNYSNFLINLALPIYIVWNTYLKDEISDCVSNINKNLSVYFLSDSNTTTKAEIHDFPID